MEFLESKRSFINGIDLNSDLKQGIMDINRHIFQTVYSVYSIFYPNDSSIHSLIQISDEFLKKLKFIQVNKEQILNWYSEKSNLDSIISFIFPLMKDSVYPIQKDPLDIQSIQKITRDWLNTMTCHLKEKIEQVLLSQLNVLELVQLREQILMSISTLEIEKVELETWKQVYIKINVLILDYKENT